MKIYGPYKRKDGRRHLCIVKADGSKTTKSYAKHLLEQELGRELVGDETADHIDEDCSNDDPGNLQILSRGQNASKTASKQPKGFTVVTCPECGASIEKESREVKRSRKLGRAGPFCGKKCAGIYSQSIQAAKKYAA